jgi:AbrB family looped-hinge helix DNA binding protein
MASRPANLTTLVSTKGQVILPKTIRDRRRWSAGTRLTVEETPDGVLLKAVPLFPATTIDEVVGILRYDGEALSLDDMDAAVAAEAKRHARG